MDKLISSGSYGTIFALNSRVSLCIISLNQLDNPLNLLIFDHSIDNDSSLGEVPIWSEAVAQKCRETPMGQQE